MARSAILLMDLQHDFLGAEGCRMPVEPGSVAPLIDTANAILDKAMLKDMLPILVVNRFPASDRIGNFFRRGAAVSGTRGAELDARIRSSSQVKVIDKASASAFTNPELDRYLRAENITDVVACIALMEQARIAASKSCTEESRKKFLETCGAALTGAAKSVV